ncbi:MAG: transposase [Nitrospirae bacterium]|nr:transposase [Nitrospirota bacterium]
MKKRVGRHPQAFRQMAVERLKRCDNISELSRELGVNRGLLYGWRRKMEPIDTEMGRRRRSRENPNYAKR